MRTRRYGICPLTLGELLALIGVSLFIGMASPLARSADSAAAVRGHTLQGGQPPPAPFGDCR